MKTEGDKKSPWVTGLDFLSDGRIAAVDYYNKKCFIMDAGLQKQGSAYKFQGNPLDVTCYGESKLAVTLGYVRKCSYLVTEILVFHLFIFIISLLMHLNVNMFSTPELKMLMLMVSYY